MGEIKIQDTGYIKATNEGTQATAGNRANSGTAISLKTAEFIPSLKRNISSQPDLASNTPSEVNKGSLENMKFKLRCLLNTKTATDMALLQHLLDCISTDSYLLMWYDYTNASTEDNNGQMIYQLALNSLFGHQITDAEKTAFSISDNFYHMHVILSEFTPLHTGKRFIINYEFSGIVIPVETSVLV